MNGDGNLISFFFLLVWVREIEDDSLQAASSVMMRPSKIMERLLIWTIENAMQLSAHSNHNCFLWQWADFSLKTDWREDERRRIRLLPSTEQKQRGPTKTTTMDGRGSPLVSWGNIKLPDPVRPWGGEGRPETTEIGSLLPNSIHIRA